MTPSFARRSLGYTAANGGSEPTAGNHFFCVFRGNEALLEPRVCELGRIDLTSIKAPKESLEYYEMAKENRLMKFGNTIPVQSTHASIIRKPGRAKAGPFCGALRVLNWLGAIVFLLVGFCLATAAQAADDTAPDIDQATAWVFYQSEMSAFSQPSSTNIQLLEEYFELVSYALDKNPAKSKEIMEEVMSRTEIQAAIDNPEWLHGIDIVVDGGRSEAPSDFELDQKQVVDRSDIWIVGWDGLILHSGDDGLSWDIQDADVKSHLQAVDFIDRGFGVAVGHNGTIVRTTDGGQSWNSSSAAGGADLFAVDCLNQEQCVAVGDFSGIIETDNGGQSWSEVKPAPFAKAAAIKMISHEIRLAAGTEIWITIDGGESWSKVFPVGFIESLLWTGSFSSLAVADIQTIWAVGRLGGMVPELAFTGASTVENPGVRRPIISIRIYISSLMILGRRPRIEPQQFML